MVRYNTYISEETKTAGLRTAQFVTEVPGVLAADKWTRAQSLYIPKKKQFQ